MNNSKVVTWILRLAVAGEFVGHGAFALQGKSQWVGWFGNFGITDPATAAQLLFFVGLLDLSVALFVLLKPIRVALLWAALWGFWTALLRPIVGESIWEFIERGANWGAPLALLFALGWPHSLREWFK